MDGVADGCADGGKDGFSDSPADCVLDGFIEGDVDGLADSSMLGACDMTLDGSVEGRLDGLVDGNSEASIDGLSKVFCDGFVVVFEEGLPVRGRGNPFDSFRVGTAVKPCDLSVDGFHVGCSDGLSDDEFGILPVGDRGRDSGNSVSDGLVAVGCDWVGKSAYGGALDGSIDISLD